jgi:hypothetical protein
VFGRAALAESAVLPNTLVDHLGDLSYSAQYDRLFQKELDTKKVRMLL